MIIVSNFFWGLTDFKMWTKNIKAFHTRNLSFAAILGWKEEKGNKKEKKKLYCFMILWFATAVI